MTEIEKKRIALLVSRIKFHPHAYSIKEEAIKKIIEQNIFLAGDEGLAVGKINKLGELRLKDEFITIINKQELDRSLKKLIKEKRLNIITISNKEQYKLSKKVFEEYQRNQINSEILIEKVLNKLFKHDSTAKSHRRNIFINICNY